MQHFIYSRYMTFSPDFDAMHNKWAECASIAGKAGRRDAAGASRRAAIIRCLRGKIAPFDLARWRNPYGSKPGRGEQNDKNPLSGAGNPFASRCYNSFLDNPD